MARLSKQLNLRRSLRSCQITHEGDRGGSRGEPLAHQVHVTGVADLLGGLSILTGDALLLAVLSILTGDALLLPLNSGGIGAGDGHLLEFLLTAAGAFGIGAYRVGFGKRLASANLPNENSCFSREGSSPHSGCAGVRSTPFP